MISNVNITVTDVTKGFIKFLSTHVIFCRKKAVSLEIMQMLLLLYSLS